MITTVPQVATTPLHRLIHTSGVCEAEWQDMLNMSWRDMAALKVGQKSVGLAVLETVAKRFNIDLNLFKTGELDFHRIQRESEKLSGWTIPEQYARAQKGRARTTITTFNYLESFSGGWKVRYDVLKHFDMSELALENDFAPISMKFISDVLACLHRRQFGHADFFKMGIYSYEANKDSILGSMLGQVATPQKVLELMWGELLQFYEENCEYRFLKLNSSGALLEVISRKEVAEEMQVSILGNEHVCSLKSGMMASSACYVWHPVAHVEEVQCAHKGAPSCRFEITFKKVPQNI